MRMFTDVECIGKAHHLATYSNQSFALDYIGFLESKYSSRAVLSCYFLLPLFTIESVCSDISRL